MRIPTASRTQFLALIGPNLSYKKRKGLSSWIEKEYIRFRSRIRPAEHRRIERRRIDHDCWRNFLEIGSILRASRKSSRFT